MKQLIFLFSFLTIGAMVNAQSADQNVIGSAGGYDTTNNVKVSWTVGEVVTETATDGNNTLTQGFHQTNLTITQIEEDLINTENFSINIYPNPAVHSVSMEVTAESVKGLKYELNDNNGKLLLKGNFLNKTEKIDFTIYQPSIYYIRIYNDKGTFVDTYKVVKDRK